MDMSICAIDKDAQKIHFAGANHKIIYVNSKLHEIGSNKIPVGYYTLNKEFTKQTINYQKGDIIYMFSDGYKDQFGGVNDKKLGNKRFKQLLQKMSGQKMDEQKSSLEDTFRKWKGKKEQVDDVTLLGIRLK
jgi:serine phosphatase RsbU (regulator of sigma subunit)